MAKSPADPNAPKAKRKPAGPKFAYVTFKGEVTDLNITRKSDEAMSALLADRDLKIVKVEIPTGR